MNFNLWLGMKAAVCYHQHLNKFKLLRFFLYMTEMHGKYYVWHFAIHIFCRDGKGLCLLYHNFLPFARKNLHNHDDKVVLPLQCMGKNPPEEYVSLCSQ